MASLTKIKLSNFQSHIDTEITLAPPGNLTVITGPSDCGKSAVIRALCWVLYNQPRGVDFINVNHSRTVVHVKTPEAVISREASTGGINRYGIDSQIYEGFGVNVPLEVQQATGIRKLDIGDQSFMLNVSEQLAGPFLGKSVSGPARAKVLGKLAGTEEVDYAGKTAGTDVYRLKRDIEGKQELLKGIDEQLKQYEELPVISAAIEEVRLLLTGAGNKQEGIQRLSAWADELEKHAIAVNTAKKDLAAFKGLDGFGGIMARIPAAMEECHRATDYAAQYSILSKQYASNAASLLSIVTEFIDTAAHLKEVEQNCGRLATLNPLRERYETARADQSRLAAVSDGLKDVDALQPLIAGMEPQLSSYAKITQLRGDYTSRLKEKNAVDQLTQIVTMSVESAQAEYLSALKDCGACPTCGTLMDTEKLTEIKLAM
jgi:DNA repair ATPase RecN